ncbi:pyridoxamine 5'-phosphate oxidase family protein [Nocardia spumae]|uniref:pyridoxamine 5'-phosphate oxidase family protein n=1 Tax=Nocardia spumae TaxID=2887190 RepID=UPI0027E08A83|nr:pyridoxamine 5'-phosphate oxidase family protein [Nocardia spumae]
MTSPDPAADGAPNLVIALDRLEAMRLLTGIGYGRIVFTRDALPAIRPVNHLVDTDGNIVVRTRLTSRLTSSIRADPQVVVAYEADDIDPVTHTGWSVVVTGLARAVTEPARIAWYEHRLRPWVAASMDTVVAIEPAIVTGVRLLGATDSATGVEPSGYGAH